MSVKIGIAAVVKTVSQIELTDWLAAQQGETLADMKKVDYRTLVNPVVGPAWDESTTVDDLKVSLTAAEAAILGLASGSPNGSYATLAALVADVAADQTAIYVVEADGNWYYYNTVTVAWESGGIYQDSTAFNDLAGAGRTTETVTQNATEIIAVKGIGWTDESLTDHDGRLDTLEGAVGITGSVFKTIKDTANDATFTPTGTIAATTLGLALAELDTDKEPAANKEAILTSGDTKFPTSGAVVTALALKADKSSLATEVSRAVTSEQQIGETLEQTFSRLMALAAQVNDSVNMYQLSAIHKVGVGYKVADDSAYDVSSTRVDGSLDVTVKGVTVSNLVENGDFAGVLSPWTLTGCTHSITDKILTVTNDGTLADSRNSVQQADVLTLGSINFATVRVRALSADCSFIVLQSVSGRITESIANPVQNQWYTLFGVNGLVETNPSLRVQFRYADQATATGKQGEIDGNYGVSAINLTASGLSHLTAAQCSAQFPYFSGTKSVPPMEMKVVGKNLFDGELESGTIEGGGLIADANRIRSKNYLRVEANTQYKLIGVTIVAELVSFYDINKVFISNSASQFTTPANCVYLKFRAYFTDITIKFQLESGTTATAYVPYKEDIAMTPVPLRSVPSIADTYDIKSGRHVRNVGSGTITGAGGLTGYIASAGINSDMSRISILISSVPWSDIAQTSAIGSIVGYNDQYTFGIGDYSQVAGYPYMFGCNGGYLFVTVKNTDLASNTQASFVAYLNAHPISIRYQLATPLITAYPPQLLTAGVHLLQQPYFYEVLITDALGQVTLDYPLGTMKRITLIEDGTSDDAPVYTTPDSTTIAFTGKADNLVAIVEYYISSDYPNPRLEYYTPISNTATRLTAVEAKVGVTVSDATDATSVITQLNALLAGLRTAGLIAT